MRDWSFQDRRREWRQFRREYAKGKKPRQFVILGLKVVGIAVVIYSAALAVFLGLMEVPPEPWERALVYLPGPKKVALALLSLVVIRSAFKKASR